MGNSRYSDISETIKDIYEGSVYTLRELNRVTALPFYRRWIYYFGAWLKNLRLEIRDLIYGDECE